MSGEDQSRWVAPKEASRITGLGLSTLAKMRMVEGMGPPFSRPLPNAVRYLKSDLSAWMASKRVKHAAE